MARFIIFIFIVFGFSFFSLSQTTLSVPSIDSEKLQSISRQHRKEYDERKREALQYAGKMQIPVRTILGDGRVLEIQYLDRDGFPVYHTTFNAAAAITVSTDILHPGGDMGLTLTGINYSVGIWDAGMVDADHPEFSGRVVLESRFEEAEDHATHVAGTVAAKGLNASARGMAFETGIKSFNWNNYLADIAKEASKGLLISNQSFGIKLGWTRDDGEWVWNGNPDADEEYRFGFYSGNQSRALDEIAFLAPEILMVWSAGNSRNGTGDGTKKPNGPFDCIGPEAIAKNVLAVGAVEQIPGGYTGPSDVRMTTFSSWGPADDGRVKPDIVAPGFRLFSTITDDRYGTTSGTSMSAPVAAGSSILLQQLFHNINGYHMRSATLKALLIHTAYDAGNSRGPDYSHGWGLLNTSGAAGIIKRSDSLSYFIRELSLNENQIYEFDIYSDGISEITATLVWTDPPGTPPPAGTINPPDLMLVNDLDIRIVDEAGNTYYPWILDPDQPDVPAVTGDNYRDNVEKILVENPEPRKYTVIISHKDELEGGSQDFSVILSASVVQDTEYQTLYWIGDGGEWNDPLNWSFSSGGLPADRVPDEEISVVIDENSFSGPSDRLVLDSAAFCRSFSWTVKQLNGIDFGGYDISVHADFFVSGGIFGADTTGSFIFMGTSGIINAGNNIDNPFRFVFDNEEGGWKLLSDIRVDNLVLRAGNLDLSSKNLTIGNFVSETDRPKYLDLSGSVLYVTGSFDLTGENLEFDSRELRVITDLDDHDRRAIIKSDTLDIDNVDILKGILVLHGNMGIGKLVNSSTIEIYGNNQISEMTLEEGSETWLAGGSEQLISGLLIDSSPVNRVLIHSLSAQPATITINDYVKLCFDYLDVYNVIAGGKAVYAAGENSLLAGETSGWNEGPCEDVLFARFEVEYPCAHANSRFIDRSDGDIKSWFWHFGDQENSGSTSVLQNPHYTFSSPGNYTVTLSINDSIDSTVADREIDISENTIAENEIFINTDLNKYVSIQTAPNYQWYNDGIAISGANERTLDMTGYTGEIRVLLWDEKCNRFSNKLVVSAYLPGIPGRGPAVYPNPADDILYIEYPGSYIGPVVFEFIDISGRVIHSFWQDKSDEILTTSVISGIFDPGYYLVRITAGREITVKSFIKK